MPESALTEIRLRVSRNEERLAELAITQQKLHALVVGDGNGVPGMAEQLRAMSKSVNDLVVRTDEWEAKEARVLRWLLGGGLTAAAAILWQVVMWAASSGGLK